jgi:hypothetical protein
MREPEKPAQQHLFLIDGKPATEAEWKRVCNAPAPLVRKEDLAQRPLHSAVCEFKLLR